MMCNENEDITPPHSTMIPKDEGREGIADEAKNSGVGSPNQDSSGIFRPSSVGDDSTSPVVAAATSGATSLETINDEINPPTPLSLMDFYLEHNGEKNVTQLGMKDVVAQETNTKSICGRQGDNQSNDFNTRDGDNYFDPNIEEKRWTRFGADSAASASSSGEQNQGPLSKMEITTILETHNSEASPIPAQYIEGFLTERDVVHRSAENVLWREKVQDQNHGSIKSNLPPVETRRTENSPSPNNLFDKNSKYKGKNKVEVVSGLPKLEMQNSDSAPVPVHFFTANDNEGQIYQQRLQEKIFQSSLIKDKERLLLDEDVAEDDTGVEGGWDSNGSLNIPEKDFDSVKSPDVDIQDSIKSNVNSNTSFDQVTHYPGDTDRIGSNPDILNLAVAQPVYEPDEKNLPLYEALEYDPSAKPPNRCNRKYFCLTAVGLVVIGVVVSVSVVFGTKEAAPQLELQYGRPSLSPTPSPTSSRALSGIMEEIESNVLRRNATFQNMTADDPRMLALEWILFDDERQLGVLDSNLHQRYIFALLAFSLDSSAWTKCGGFDELGTCTSSPNDEVIMGGDEPWLSESNECDWYGVTCVVGIARGLELANNNLIGEIVPEIAGLRNHLVVLDLSENCLYGTLPHEIGDLSSLELLKLSSNSFSGTFPEDLYKLSKLQQLDLAYQYFNDRNCTRSDGNVVSLMHQMGDPKNPFNNGIEGSILDDRIGGWSNLETLFLENNFFHGRISSEIGKLKRLVHFNAAVNIFAGSLPGELTEMRNLKELWMEENFLTGNIPHEVGRMESLEILSVWRNPNMTGTIPDSLYNLTKLEQLFLAENDFSGTLSTDIGNLRRLSHLQIYGNNFSGTLPSELGLCRDLEFIRLESNEFSGSVPEQVCALRGKVLFSEDSTIEFFRADCLPDNITSQPRLQCDCCHSCCDGTTGQCQILE